MCFKLKNKSKDQGQQSRGVFIQSGVATFYVEVWLNKRDAICV